MSRLRTFLRSASHRRLAVFLAPALLGALPGHGAAAPEVELWPEGVPDLRADAAPTRVENGRYLGIHFPTLTVYTAPAGPATGTAVIYCPGGGYERVAAGVNGGEIAAWLGSLGITVFELHYRNKEYGHPAPLRDVLRAVRVVRSRAAEFGVRPDRLGMLGGSAGGHLTATAGTLFDHALGRTGAALDTVSARPDFMILVFPVITMAEPHAHGASRRNLLGAEPAPEAIALMSVERHVTRATPPAFIVHAQEDRTVTVFNSLLFYEALTAAGVPAEMHLFPRGPHGAGLDPRLGPTAEWPRRCEAWLRFHGWLPAADATP